MVVVSLGRPSRVVALVECCLVLPVVVHIGAYGNIGADGDRDGRDARIVAGGAYCFIVFRSEAQW